MQYLKIKQTIVEQIDSGLLSPRQKLPAERQFAELFDTTRVTLREALSLLEAEGKIYREDRRGWFISPPPLNVDPSHSFSFSATALAQERTPSTDVLSMNKLLAPKEASVSLDLPAFSDVYGLERVRYLEKRPVMYVKSYCTPNMFPNLSDHDLTQSLIGVFKNGYGIDVDKVHFRMRSTSLIGAVAQALRATTGTPALLIERVNMSKGGQLISCDVEYWRHDSILIESTASL